MDRLPLNVEGGNPGGCQHRHLLPRVLPEVFEKRRLPRSRLAGDENVPAGVLHDHEGLLKLGIDLNERPAHDRLV